MEKFKFNKIPDATQLDIPFDEKKEIENSPTENKESFLSKQELDELYSGNDNKEEFERYNRFPKEEQIKKHHIIQQNPKSKKRINNKFKKNNSVEAILRRDLLR